MEDTTVTAGTAIDLEEFHWMRPGRAPVACLYCRGQRIRCDVALRKGSCTNCEFYEVECQVATGKRNGSDLIVTIPASEVCIAHTNGAVGPTRDTKLSQSTSPVTEKPAHLSDEEYVLLRNKGVFEMPSTSLRHRIIEAYLRHLYSHMPIISFQDLVFMADPGRRYPNWLVFMALCAISVNLVDKGRLRELGVTSTKEASQMFLTKAEVLYRFQWQGHHKYCTLQALLLLAFYEQEICGGDGWTWTWMAYTTAVQMGLDQTPTEKCGRRERGLRRRLWWTCYSQCCLLSLHTTSSHSIRVTESGIPPLTEEDFEPYKPVYCLELIPALTAAQESSLSFVQRVHLLCRYNECIFRRSVPDGEGGAGDVFSTLKGILRSATKQPLKALLDPDAVGESSSVCEVGASPLDAGSNSHPQNTAHLDSDTVLMVLDLERVLYNCTYIEVDSGCTDKTVQ